MSRFFGRLPLDISAKISQILAMCRPPLSTQEHSQKYFLLDTELLMLEYFPEHKITISVYIS